MAVWLSPTLYVMLYRLVTDKEYRQLGRNGLEAFHPRPHFQQILFDVLSLANGFRRYAGYEPRMKGSSLSVTVSVGLTRFFLACDHITLGYTLLPTFS